MIKLTFTGDIVLADTCFDVGFGFNEKVKREGNYKFLSAFAEPFQKSDVSIANMEFVISDTTDNKSLDAVQFIASAKILKVLSELPVNFWGIANNHILDHGLSGFNNTLASLKEAGIKTIGNAENPYQIIEKDGFKTAIICASAKYDSFKGDASRYYSNIYLPKEISIKEFDEIINGLEFENKELFIKAYVKEENSYKLVINEARASLANEIKLFEIIFDAYCSMKLENEVFKQIKILKDKCDLIVMYLHWGDEYVNVPAPWQVKFAHKLVDLGAGLVVGCHSHSIQGIEEYKNSAIAYSLGNYYFNSNNPIENLGLILQVSLEERAASISIKDIHVAVSKYDPQKMTANIITDKTLENNYLQSLDYYSSKIANMDLNNYIKLVYSGLKVSRYYKKRFLLKHIFRVKPRLLVLICKNYLERHGKVRGLI